MISACEAAGVGLFVAYYRRAMPRFVTVKNLLDGGRIGELRSVIIRNERPGRADVTANAGWRVDPTISGGGHFVDLGSHTLDLLDWLLGPVIRVSGVATNRGGRYPAEDHVTAAFSFHSGAEGVGLWNYDSFQHADLVEVIGTAGALCFSCFADEPLRLTTARGVEHIAAPYPEIVHCLYPGRGRCPDRARPSPSDGHSAVRTARVIDTLLSPYRQSHGITYPPGSYPVPGLLMPRPTRYAGQGCHLRAALPVDRSWVPLVCDDDRHGGAADGRSSADVRGDDRRCTCRRGRRRSRRLLRGARGIGRSRDDVRDHAPPPSPSPTASTAPAFPTASTSATPTAMPPFVARAQWVRGSGGRSLQIFPTASGRAAQGASMTTRRGARWSGSAPDADQPGMRAQFDCHWTFARLVDPDKPSWNIEPWRRSSPTRRWWMPGATPGAPESAES